MLTGCFGTIDEEALQNLAFEDVTVDYDGEAHSIYVDNKYKIRGVEVTYKNNQGRLPGEYVVTAIIEYKDIKVEKTATLTINGKESILEAEEELTFYTNSEVVIDYKLSNDLQIVNIVDENGEKVDVKSFVKPGTYIVELYAEAAGLFAESNHVTVTINIVKSMYDIKFESKEVIADGTEHVLEITGNIPSGYTVEYENNKGIDDGNYFAKAYLKDASGKVVETHQAVLKIDNPENEEFAQYLDEFFVTYLEDDQLSVNIFCENPADFGLEHYEAVWYSYEPFGDAEIEDITILMQT